MCSVVSTAQNWSECRTHDGTNSFLEYSCIQICGHIGSTYESADWWIKLFIKSTVGLRTILTQTDTVVVWWCHSTWNDFENCSSERRCVGRNVLVLFSLMIWHDMIWCYLLLSVLLAQSVWPSQMVPQTNVMLEMSRNAGFTWSLCWQPWGSWHSPLCCVCVREMPKFNTENNTELFLTVCLHVFKHS